ncbi:MAG: PEP-CTERM sorting domain-containing protein [Planctomycetes bacterium]|nr:PEP-CTERM sorting domain-containing protein [Planctomycetota bacterium]
MISRQSGRLMMVPETRRVPDTRFGIMLGSAAIAATVIASGVGLCLPAATVRAAAVAIPTIAANPISLTGFNQDSVVENTYTVSTANGGYIPNTVAVPFDSGTNYSGNVLYEKGLLQDTSPAKPYAQGLPTSGQFTGGAFSSEFNVSFQFQNYTNTDNVLNLSGTPNEITGTPNGNTGTLTLTTPASYDGLAILAMGARGGGPGAVTLNFSNGTSVTTDYAAQDWFSGTTNTYTPDGNPYGYAISNFGRISTVNSSGGQGAHMDETILNLADLSNGTTVGNYSGLQLTSLTFQQAPGSNPVPNSTNPNGGSSNIFAVSGFTQAIPAAPAAMTPVAVTGFNQDSVVPNTYTVVKNGAIPTSVAVQLAPGDTNTLYEYGLAGSPTGGGLPPSGQFVSSFAGSVSVVGQTTFQLQSYTANTNNVLELSAANNFTHGAPTGTLTLSTAKRFSQLAILAFSDDATNNSYGQVTLNFADGTSVTTDYGAPDWYSNGSGVTPDGNQYGVAAANFGRINTSNSDFSSGAEAYQTILNLANLSNGTTFGNYTNELLSSLTFSQAIEPGNKNASVGATVILGISGTEVVPEPATLALLAVAAASSLLLLRRRKA